MERKVQLCLFLSPCPQTAAPTAINPGFGIMPDLGNPKLWRAVKTSLFNNDRLVQRLPRKSWVKCRAAKMASGALALPLHWFLSKPWAPSNECCRFELAWPLSWTLFHLFLSVLNLSSSSPQQEDSALMTLCFAVLSLTWNSDTERQWGIYLSF